jgi:hypothetical protein
MAWSSLSNAAARFIDPVGWTLLHFLWQGVVVAAALALVLGRMRRASAAAKYVACCTALASMAALPVLTLIVLISHKPYAAVAAGATRDNVYGSAAAPASASDNARRMESPTDGDFTPEAGGGKHRPAFDLPALRPALPWLVIAWAAGV